MTNRLPRTSTIIVVMRTLESKVTPQGKERCSLSRFPVEMFLKGASVPSTIIPGQRPPRIQTPPLQPCALTAAIEACRGDNRQSSDSAVNQRKPVSIQIKQLRFKLVFRHKSCWTRERRVIQRLFGRSWELTKRAVLVKTLIHKSDTENIKLVFVHSLLNRAAFIHNVDSKKLSGNKRVDKRPPKLLEFSIGYHRETHLETQGPVPFISAYVLWHVLALCEAGCWCWCWCWRWGWGCSVHVSTRRLLSAERTVVLP